ncbi:MAG TPA: DUF3126 family protein [Caulobacterales bacterium]|nr:DUF3126 family protein [Caulobacterales bacterium]
MKPEERERVEAYLRMRFGQPNIQVRARPRKDDSAEVYIGEEFAGVLSRDDEDGDLCYHFTMTVLELDLEEGEDD